MRRRALAPRVFLRLGDRLMVRVAVLDDYQEDIQAFLQGKPLRVLNAAKG
jgi:hypothetical protein